MDPNQPNTQPNTQSSPIDNNNPPVVVTQSTSNTTQPQPYPAQVNPMSQSTTPVSPVYAGFIARLIAYIIDSVLISVVLMFINMFSSFVITIVATLITTFLGMSKDENGIVLLLFMIISMIFQFILFSGYFVILTSKSGQTLGKRIMKIKVVNKDTFLPPSMRQAILRESLGKILSALLFNLGYLWMLWDKRKQTWHDKLGKTIVIDA